MKIALIAPTNYLSYYGNLTDYHMALTHLVIRDPHYRKFYRNRSEQGHHVILDNSVIELGSSVTVSALVEAARVIGAQEMILPDVLDDSEATLRSTFSAIQELDNQYLRASRPKVMAVPQGKTIEEFIRCYTTFAQSPAVDVIGIPKRVGYLMPAKETGTGRVNVLQYMLQQGAINQNKPHHLLGIHDNPNEIYLLNHYRWIRGIDSQLPFWAAKHNIEWNHVLGSTTRRRAKDSIILDDPNFHLTREQEDICGHNILCMMRWANNDVISGF